MSSKPPPIPRIPHAFFRWYCRPEMYEELHGDLEEFFYDRLERSGLFLAQLAYWWNVLRCCQPYSWRSFAGQSNSNIGMLTNFYFTAVRNLLKHKRYFLLNVVGLGVGVASFAFIAFYVANELSYDRFHESYDRKYRLSNESVIRGEPNYQATSAAPMAGLLLERYPEVQEATRILDGEPLLVGKGARQFIEDDVLYVDDNFFQFFDLELIQGDPLTAFEHARSIVLTASMAEKYFGHEDPIGQQMGLEEEGTFYTVTGVAGDPPPNSHIQFDLLVSLRSHAAFDTEYWIAGNHSVHTYVLLHEATAISDLEVRMRELFYEFMAPEIEYFTGLAIAQWEAADNHIAFRLVPIADIHLRSVSWGELEPSGNITYVVIYGLIGLILLGIAIFNFVNLATAHAATRTREVGIRKIIGSTRQALMVQFLLESILVATAATTVGFVLLLLLEGTFLQIVGKELAFGVIRTPEVWLALPVFATVVGVLAGIYPAMVLSRMTTERFLKGASSKTRHATWLRNLLVTLQFTASLVIMIGTVAAYRQIDHMLSKDLGFDKEQILVVKRPDWLGNAAAFEEELRGHPKIRQVARSQTLPGKNYDIRSYRRKDDTETFLFLNNQVTYDYLETMGLELLDGRFFSKGFASDSNAVVLNEAAARAFGFDNPVGEQLSSAFKSGRSLNVIGLVKDFHYESLHKEVLPLSFELDNRLEEGFISINVASDEKVRETLAYIEDQWYTHTNEKPFIHYFFNDEYQKIYDSESNTARVLTVFATLSVLIACMGLVGLIAYTTAVRKKEMGIRKVLGASFYHLIQLLSSQIVRLLVLATLLSWPIAYYLTNYWLQNFADRISLSPTVYLAATLGMAAIVAVATGFQTISTARSNPVDSLRSE